MITYLNLGRNGRLGNQMFQIASTIGIAISSGLDYGFPHWINHDHRDRFRSNENVDIEEYFIHDLPRVAPDSYRPLDVPWGYHSFRCPDKTSLGGYLQSEKYFIHCREKILYHFDLVPYINIPFIDENCVAIHVRRGDYDEIHHPRLGMEYYGKALEQLPVSSKLFVFSDDIAACRQMFGSNAEYIEGNHYMKDFYMMTLFSKFIIANSSFSWWGAWLSKQENKTVFAPSRWFGPAYTISPEDIYAQNWNVI